MPKAKLIGEYLKIGDKKFKIKKIEVHGIGISIEADSEYIIGFCDGYANFYSIKQEKEVDSVKIENFDEIYSKLFDLALSH